MKKFMEVLFVCVVVLFMAASCGDETTTIDGSVPVTVDGPVNVLDIGTCTNNAQCVVDEVCEEVDDFESSQGKTVPVSMCVFGCEAELKTDVTVNADGTSTTVVSKVAGTDTCQRNGATTLTCDMRKDSATFRQCIQTTGEAADSVEPAAEPEQPATEPATEPAVEPDEGDTEIVCYFILAGVPWDEVWGQFAWSEATVDDPDAWGAARDLEITPMGEFSAMVIYSNVFGGVFYADLTNDVHTGVKEHDDEIDWVGEYFAKPDCSIDGYAATVGPFKQGAGWPFWLE